MELSKTATELGQAIGSGQMDPRDLTRAYLAAIAAHHDSPRIYARTTAARALAEAEAAAARARSGTRRHPLDGVPISWKDLFDTAGIATEAGSRLLAGRTPRTDATVLARATANGLICLGKTHMTELAFSGLGINEMTATPPNAIAPDRTAGGSSSGAAVSVKLGLAAAGIGSDTGGSVRVPAAWNNLVGLKTTSGALPLDGVVPLCARFDTVGPLAHSVADAALLFHAMGGIGCDLAQSDLSGRRLLVCDTIALDGLEAPLDTAFEGALHRLAAAGASIHHAKLPMLDTAFTLNGPLFAVEAYATWGQTIEANPQLMHPNLIARFRGGAQFSGIDFVRAWQDLGRLRHAWAMATAGYDAVLAPTTPILPPNAARLIADPDYFSARNLLALRNTRIGNLMGLCGLTLPTGTDFCGLMVLCAPHTEGALLRLGAAMERALR